MKHQLRFTQLLDASKGLCTITDFTQVSVSGECRDKTCPGIRCSDLFVHGSGVVLPDGIGHGQHLHRKGAGAQLNFDLVPWLYLVACLGDLAVNADAAVVAGLVGHGTALDETGDLEIFVQPHLTWKRRPSEPWRP